MQFSDTNTQSDVDNDLKVEPNGDEYVTRADFDSLARRVDELESLGVATESETDDSFGGLSLVEFVKELADAQYGKGVRPVRPGQFDVKSDDK